MAAPPSRTPMDWMAIDYVIAPEAYSPVRCRELQEQLNADLETLGVAMFVRVIVLPGGSRVEPGVRATR